MILRRIWTSFLLLFTKEIDRPVSDSEYAALPSLFHMDNYDNCMLYGNSSLYCGTVMRLSPRNPENVSDVWRNMQKLNKTRRHLVHEFVAHIYCVPRECPDINQTNLDLENVTNLGSKEFIEEYEECLSDKFTKNDLKTKILLIKCLTDESPYNYNYFDDLFALFLLIVVGLVLFAWIYDMIKKPNFQDKNFKQSTFGKYISSFSLSQNWTSLTKIDLSNPDAKALSSLQGVRFFNFVAVILTHGSMFTILQPPLNPIFFQLNVDSKFEQFIAAGGRLTTLQTFFLVSSFLHAYQFFRDCEGKERVSLSYLVRSFVNRYFRLTPMVAIISIFFGTLMPHLSRGPFWDLFVGEGSKVCRRTWWYNVLYINGLVPLEQMCLGHLWSMSVDVQLYVVGLLVLWLMWNYEKKIPYILGTLWIYHVVQTFFSFYGQFPNAKKIDLEEITNFDIDKLDFSKINETQIREGLAKVQEMFLLYKSTTCNMSGLITGLGFGYLYHKYKNKNIFTSNIHVNMWWIASWGAMGFIVTFPGFFINFLIETEYIELYICVFMAVSRSIFTIGVGLFIFGMTQGQGHIIKSFCEWPGVYVLGRLNYNAYLVHVLIMRFVSGTRRTPTYLSLFTLFHEFIAYLALTYLASAFLTLFFEYPFAAVKRHVADMMRKENIIEDDKKTK